MICETTEYIDPDVQQKHQLISRNGRVGGPGLGRQSAGLVHAVDASPSFLLDPLAFGTASGAWFVSDSLPHDCWLVLAVGGQGRNVFTYLHILSFIHSTNEFIYLFSEHLVNTKLEQNKSSVFIAFY